VASAFAGQFSSAEAVTAEEIIEGVNSDLAPQHAYGELEATRILEMMSDKEEIMFSDGTVYRL
jgi:hypothetical protein